MRYTRLRRAIEDGTLIGTNGAPFQSGADKIAEAQKKRKRPTTSFEMDDAMTNGPIHTRSGNRLTRPTHSDLPSLDDNEDLEPTGEGDTPLVKRRASSTTDRLLTPKNKPASSASPLWCINDHPEVKRGKSAELASEDEMPKECMRVFIPDFVRANQLNQAVDVSHLHNSSNLGRTEASSLQLIATSPKASLDASRKAEDTRLPQ